MLMQNNNIYSTILLGEYNEYKLFFKCDVRKN